MVHHPNIDPWGFNELKAEVLVVVDRFVVEGLNVETAAGCPCGEDQVRGTNARPVVPANRRVAFTGGRSPFQADLWIRCCVRPVIQANWNVLPCLEMDGQRGPFSFVVGGFIDDQLVIDAQLHAAGDTGCEGEVSCFWNSQESSPRGGEVAGLVCCFEPISASVDGFAVDAGGCWSLGIGIPPVQAQGDAMWLHRFDPNGF